MSAHKLLILKKAAVGIEPTNKGFADLCLTTWLRRRVDLKGLNELKIRPKAGLYCFSLKGHYIFHYIEKR